MEEVLIYELSDQNGRLQQHDKREFAKYKDALNGTQLTKKIRFWAVKYPDTRVDAKQIADVLGVSLDAVNDALHKLNQIDLVYRSSWMLFNGISNPMLCRYIEYNYRQAIEEALHAGDVAGGGRAAAVR